MAKSSNKTKFYAVRVGKSPGVYESWPEVQKQVTGWKGAQHKSFASYQDAQSWLSEKGSSFSSRQVSAATSTNGPSSWPPSKSNLGSSSGTSSNASGDVSMSSNASSSASSLNSTRSTPYDRPPRRGLRVSRRKPREPRAPRAPRVPRSERGYQRRESTFAKAKYERKPLDMKWSPEVEAQLVADGWIVAFTDGACKANGKKRAIAGSGVFWHHPRTAPAISERVPGKQSNQCAELYAILRALEEDPKPSEPLHIFTDSSYSIQCLTDWITLWMRRGWKTAQGEPVENADLIKLIHFMMSKRTGPVELSWVKGHSSIPGNIVADSYAMQGAGRPEVQDRDFAAELEERFKAHRTAKKDAVIDESWLLTAEEEMAELEDL